ncbi:RcnB family protein [Stenotrophomonas sp. MMGLT7]|uniref:RcnB family protein n=1 Tax=Stenotrophomonas sp. MMGLT7 TaxID=2901227 RepID=UPI001E428646|nr:RcnB family protein [Stenotrophomonas sp. MMGLT7]MCD7099989.1 RcnB family protein [Stenotrophomonas sp. MMGLT7]
MRSHRLPLVVLCSLLALGAAAPAFADNDRDRDHRRYERGHDRGHDRRGDSRGRDDRRHYSSQRPAYRPARPPVAHYRPAPPPRWARGQRYNDHYRGPVYVVNDYRGYRLRQPPRGYHWIRDDRGDFLMVAVATGIIADLVLNGR